jgi:hypothetical protein
MCGKAINIFHKFENQYGDAVFGAVKAIHNLACAKSFLDSYLAEVQKVNNSLFAAANAVKDTVLIEMGRQGVNCVRREMWVRAIHEFFREHNTRMDLPLQSAAESVTAPNTEA